MTPAFCDTSALVPLCVQQQPTGAVRDMLGQYEIAVWWATSVEMRSAFERLWRMGQLTSPEHAAAGSRLDKLRRGWRELQPTEALRAQAEAFLKICPLKAADALQLAAAWTWCSGDVQSCTFISADAQLVEAAQQGWLPGCVGLTPRCRIQRPVMGAFMVRSHASQQRKR